MREDDVSGGTPAADLTSSSEDVNAVRALRAHDEATFAALVDRYAASLLRLARVYVRDAATAEEVVQDTWIALLESLDRFEGRSSLKTWLFRILMNCARARARKDARTVPFSAAFRPEDVDAGQAPGRFVPGWVPAIGGHWMWPVAQWRDEPESRALAAEVRQRLQETIDALPPVQREVITLRDVLGFEAGEVCNVLGISDTNQRVILHRARTRVRQALHRQLGEGAG